MKRFTVPQSIADKLESETRYLLDNNKPAWKLLTGMHNYSDYQNFEEFKHIGPIKQQPTCFFDPIYYFIRDYKIHGPFEQMVKHIPLNFPSIVELVNHLRDEYLDSSYDLCRLYVNLLPKAPKSFFPPHMDMKRNDSYTFLYYIIDSDGDTFTFDEDTKKIIDSATPLKGTGIYFPSSTIHAASTPTTHDIRIVANVIFSKNLYARSS